MAMIASGAGLWLASVPMLPVLASICDPASMDSRLVLAALAPLSANRL